MHVTHALAGEGIMEAWFVSWACPGAPSPGAGGEEVTPGGCGVQRAGSDWPSMYPQLAGALAL